MISVVTIETPTLGDRSYLAHDGRVAIVVDPQRDIDRVLAAADLAGVSITHVFETHVHNDYVTGGYALARAIGASYHLNGADAVDFERNPVADGDVVAISEVMSIRVVATPGHTYTHMSYVLQFRGEPVGVFTGGSLLFGATGRPDLAGTEHTATLARHQHASARRLANEVPDAARILPTHGFGSFCSATQTEATESTMGLEKSTNPVLIHTADHYVAELLAGLDVFPAYYAHMSALNLAGPGPADLSQPGSLGPAALQKRIEAGEWVIDVRVRTDFSAGFVAGSVNFGIDGQLATYVGWLVPWGAAMTLLGESREQVREAQRELARIGIDRPAAVATGSPQSWSTGPLNRLERATFADLARVRRHRLVTVVDVRRESEWRRSHISGALNLPLHDILDGLTHLSAGEVWVHCAGGYRASIAASVFAAHGFEVVVVDDSFEEGAVACGLPLVLAETSSTILLRDRP